MLLKIMNFQNELEKHKLTVWSLPDEQTHLSQWDGLTLYFHVKRLSVNQANVKHNADECTLEACIF